MKEGLLTQPTLDTEVLGASVKEVMRISLDRLHRGPHAPLFTAVIAGIWKRQGYSAYPVIGQAEHSIQLKSNELAGVNRSHFMVRLAVPGRGLQAVDPGYLWLADKVGVDTFGLPGTLISTSNEDTGAVVWPADVELPAELTEVIEPAHYALHHQAVESLRVFDDNDKAQKIISKYLTAINQE
jgi:hypothetical protein